MLKQKKKYIDLTTDFLTIPEHYESPLDLKKTQVAIDLIRETFRQSLARALNLSRVSAPIMVYANSGINDDLNGIERPVSFPLGATGETGEIVQSLAKWKRMALADYDFEPGEGLYTNMNAVRPDELPDKFHSLYVDQWDWERIMRDDERNHTFLNSIVQKIYAVIRDTEKIVCKHYPELPEPYLPEKIHFITAEALLHRYPDKDPKEREIAIAKEFGAVFIRGIGAPLSNGVPHDGRAADYDDWSTEAEDGHPGLNGDIIIYNRILDTAMELSSMGIRVNPEALIRQLKHKKEMHKTKLYFHKRLLNGELPQTIGGGIGQSRLCMFFLRKVHIGEVHSSIWPDEIRKICKDHNIHLL
jgi:aspartate--ammonia ligase